MKAERALCISSGMTALDIILRLVASSDEVVAGDDIYGGEFAAAPSRAKIVIMPCFESRNQSSAYFYEVPKPNHSSSH
jgi:O-acetylhomoserine/O-acetylserine sulfhydrylase-like pyridoxal-dependent enzyme